MNILFCTPINIYSTLLETELELMQRHLDAGDEVHLLLCRADLPVCEINERHSKLQCLYCSQKHLHSLRLLNGKVKVHYLRNYWPSEELKPQTQFPDIAALKKYRWDEYFDIGYGMGSYLISKFRDLHLDLGPHRQIIEGFMNMSLRLYVAVRNFLDENKMDRVYVWNGRQPSMRPVLRAAKSKGVDFYTFNSAQTVKHVETFENALLHDLSHTGRKIINHWNNSAEPEDIKIKKGSLSYERRTQATHDEEDEDNIYRKNRFTAGMQQGQLPDNWDASKINIAIFNSSEDELASISDEWINPLYEGQFEGLTRLIQDTDNDPAFEQYHFYLRMHPNLANVANEDVRRIKALTGKRFTLLPPESPVNTYSLIKASAAVVTYGSSAGIEAVYHGKPSILLGKSFYHVFENTTYQPASHEAFIELLKQQPLAPKEKTGAYMYGYFWTTYGQPMKYVSSEKGRWMFRGKKTRSHPLLELMKKIKQKSKIRS